jgi:hypothetical protein
MRTVPLLNQAQYDQAWSAILLISGGGSVDDSINLVDDFDALADATDSTDPASHDESIIVASHTGSNTHVAPNSGFEDHMGTLDTSKTYLLSQTLLLLFLL